MISLAPRQQEVVALLREGYSNGEIAEQLGISLQAVKHHLTAIGARCGISGNGLRVKVLVALDGLALNKEKLAQFKQRDATIIRGVCAGKINREIAHDIGLSPYSTRRELVRIYDQTGASSHLELLGMFTV